MENQAVDSLLLESLVSTTSLESLVKGYILNCRSEGKTPKTIQGYEMVLKNFVWFCKKENYPEVHKLKSIHIRQFIWYLGSETDRWDCNIASTKHPASSTTANGYFRALRTFFNFLEREELILENPFKNLKPPRIDTKAIQALTPSEIEKLFKLMNKKTALDVRNTAILSVLLDTGLRISELANLSIDDVNLETGSVLVKYAKNHKQRIVRIGIKVQKILWRYIYVHRKGRSNALFLNRSGDPLDVVGIKILIKRLGQKAGVKVHPHKLRHTFAISYLRAGGDVFSLQYLLGHSTLSMTQRYLQSLNANDAANAHKKYSPLDNLGKY